MGVSMRTQTGVGAAAVAAVARSPCPPARRHTRRPSTRARRQRRTRLRSSSLARSSSRRTVRTSMTSCSAPGDDQHRRHSCQVPSSAASTRSTCRAPARADLPLLTPGSTGHRHQRRRRKSVLVQRQGADRRPQWGCCSRQRAGRRTTARSGSTAVCRSAAEPVDFKVTFSQAGRLQVLLRRPSGHGRIRRRQAERRKPIPSARRTTPRRSPQAKAAYVKTAKKVVKTTVTGRST